MKNIIKNERGVSLISLAVAIIIIGIITGMLLYNVKDTKDIERLTNMYSDVDNISDRVSNYYSRYGALPVLKNIDLSSDTTISNWVSELQSSNNNGPLGANDSDKFYVIDLKALDNLTLNYGSGFAKLTNESTTITDRDVYIINEKSHNIFFLPGIKVNNNGNIKMYYTNKEKDVEAVNLKYVDGINIPDGFIYKSGSTKNDLKIEKVVSGGTNIEYTWANTQDKVYTITELENDYYLNDSENHSNKIVLDTVNGQNKDDFISSLREFGGCYFTVGSQISTVFVNYFSIAEEDNWGKPYKTTVVYTDINGDTAYIPKDFKISKLSSLNTINKGLVIKNATTNDEYVWIDVPKIVLANTRTLEEIENALKDYAKEYRADGYEDTWVDGCLTMTSNPSENSKTVYSTMKNEMYQSIKNNGGFWISRDEYTDNDKTCSKALANARAKNISNKKCSLLFGIQCDLVCKFISGDSNEKNIKNFSTNNKEWTLEYNNTKAVLRNATQRESVNLTDNVGNDVGYRIMIY